MKAGTEAGTAVLERFPTERRERKGNNTTVDHSDTGIACSSLIYANEFLSPCERRGGGCHRLAGSQHLALKRLNCCSLLWWSGKFSSASQGGLLCTRQQ